MSVVADRHQRAMELAETAILARMSGNSEDAARLNREALVLESEAAAELRDQFGAEPTRSVLYRSAATIALDCDELVEAERLIAAGLCGRPPDYLADELRQLLERVHLEMHLRARGLELAPEEIEVVFAGPGVRTGLIRARGLVDRMEALQKLVFRVAERESGLAFRERGRRPQVITNRFSLLAQAPRAGSFGITFRVARISRQLDLPGIGESLEIATASDTLAQLIACLEAVNRGDREALQQRIPSPAYLRNFVGLARNLAPDGDDVESVLVAANARRTPSRVDLDHPLRDLSAFDAVSAAGSGQSRVTI
ncbi:MAG TPA: hypothetical protein VGB13_02085, partial [Candidatus Krumholzibacteria bacterium]